MTLQPLSQEQSNRLKKIATIASVSLAVSLSLLKTFGALYTGSLAVLSSMIDSLADIFASSVTYIAVKYASKPASDNHRYGYGKAEALSALIQSAFIAGSGIFVMYDGFSRFLSPKPLEQTDTGIIIMVISLVSTVALIFFQKYVTRRTKSQAISADSAHYAVDVMTNASIILSLLVVKFFNISWFDTLTAFVISASMAGAAGALFALNYSTIAANKFDFNASILILVFVVFGGLGNMLGSVIAAALLTALPEALRSFADYRMLIYAIVLIVVMIFNQSPQMIAMRKRLTARFRKDAAGKAPKKNKKEAA